ncbi:hypothetical protein AAHE18_01G138600 [Arachis hypogaea]
MIDQYKHQQLRIGSVTKPYTFHYKTNKPEKDGLFCERIFGPVKSGICACGNYRVIGEKKKDNQKFCEQCGVEFVDSRIRRYQMGYIKLACPVTHVWYLKRLPSYIANLLDKPLKELEGGDPIDPLVGSYPNFSFARPVVKKPTFLRLRGLFEYEIQSWKYSIPLFFTIQGFDTFRNREISSGAGAIREQLGDLEFDNSYKFFIKLAKHFIRTNINPEWMVLCLLPVLPPELRPIIQIDGGKLMSSDINELYRRIYAKRISNVPVNWDGHNKVYKSFSDIIEGKEGRFRETLLGKRVDYSGRSVIVVGPSLSLHRCGLPREIAIELFQTFVIRGLIRKHFASNMGIAKSKIREKEPIVWEILQEIMQGHPVLLNRAPTLHRLGIQAFQPILVEGRAICLHPLVCKGFNADFDGDQMAVHVPLSLEAQTEARLLMFSHMNLLSPSMGDPISVPTQDMLIGLYILTSGNRRGISANRYSPCNRRNSKTERIYNNNNRYTKKKKEPFFCNSYDAIGAYRQKKINFDSPLWFRWRLDQRVISSREAPIEVHYEPLGIYHEIYGHYIVVRSIKKQIRCIYIRTTVGHISFYREIEEAIQGFCRAHLYSI